MQEIKEQIKTIRWITSVRIVKELLCCYLQDAGKNSMLRAVHTVSGPQRQFTAHSMLFKFWMLLSDIIRLEYIYRQHKMVTSAFLHLAGVKAGISARWFFITDPLWLYTAALFSRGYVLIEWRWARVKITTHIHLTNLLYNTPRKKKKLRFIGLENAVFAL